MELYFNKLIVKQLNKDYQTIRMNKDLPYELDSIKFIRFYKDIENVFEIETFLDFLNKINEELENNYSIYANDTHLIFDENYLDYKSVFKVLKDFKKAFEFPTIDYNKTDLEALSKLIIHCVDDRMQYLNIKYKELFLSYEDDKFVKLIKDDSIKIMNEKADFKDVIEFMCKFNNEFFNFKRRIQTKTVDKKTREFIKDSYEIVATFRMVLKIYFRFMIINNYSDENMINYSGSYLNK